jgi:hypothetical protein
MGPQLGPGPPIKSFGLEQPHSMLQRAPTPFVLPNSVQASKASDIARNSYTRLHAANLISDQKLIENNCNKYAGGGAMGRSCF